MKQAEQLTHSVARFAIANPLASRALIEEIKKQGLQDFGQQLESIVANKAIERN